MMTEGIEAQNSILIIEGETESLQILYRILGDEYVLYSAKNYREAIEKANELPIDVILLAAAMPWVSGYDVLEALKKVEKTKEIPVIIMTEMSDGDDELKGLDLGASDYIAKPFHETIVKLRVQNQIRIVNQIRAIERLSTIDQLTDIANKRSFNQQLNMEWRRAIRNKQPLSIMMLDVDLFKNFNDTYGHLQGDVVLQSIAKTLVQTLKRPADFAARWGGEEFAVLLPVTDIEGAMLNAENIRRNIERTIVTCAPGVDTNVTVSIGVNTLIPTIRDSMNDFVNKADMALYNAKRTGRNKVCAALETER